MVLHGPAALVAHSKVVPAPQPVADMVPVVDGHTLFIIVIVGCVGVVHVPGTVTIAVDVGLDMVLSISQLHLVSMLCAGPVWAYVGNVEDQAPPLTLYCNVVPVGHGVPVGAVIVPPATVHELLQVLLTIVTLAGAVLNVGHVTHEGVKLKLSSPNSSLEPVPPTSAPDHLKYIKLPDATVIPVIVVLLAIV